MTEILKSISDGIAGLSGTALTFAGALAIAGTLAMAFLQIIKELTPIRRYYQRRWLERWFRVRVEKFTVDGVNAGPNVVPSTFLQLVSVAEVQSTLVELATGGEVNAFYDLAIEQVVAQMNAAAQIALEYPHTHFPLLAVLSQGANVGDVMQVVKRAEAGSREPDPAALDARNRVGHRIQRNLDGIQIALGSRWKLWMQLTSISLTVAFVELAIIANVEYDPATLLVGVVLGIVGGYLAPVTRDVVATLQSLRKG